MLRSLLSRTMRYLLLSVLTAGLLFACNTQQPVADSASTPSPTGQPLVVGSSPWPGFSAHYIAVEKGFFEEEGVVVEDQFFQVATDANTALLAGKLDMAWLGVPDMVIMAGRDPSLRLVMLADYSNGADGVLVRNITSVEEIAGKQVAWEELPLQILLLKRCLETAGLTQDDVQLLTMSAAEAATAFASNQIDVAVTYEPWLTKAAEEGKGTLIFTSKDSNIIPDGLASKQTVIEERRDDIIAYMRAIDKGVAFMKDSPEEAAAIVAKQLGVEAADVPGLWSGVRFFNAKDNVEVVFNPDNPLNVVDSLEFAAKTGLEMNLVENPIDATAIYDDSLIKAL